MKIVCVKGGLGNQMFQYALYRRLLADGFEAKLDISFFSNISEGTTVRQLELPEVFPDLPLSRESYASDEEIKQLCQEKITTIKDNGANPFNPDNLAAFLREENCYFNGYWQNEAFFSSIAETIRLDFRFDEKSLCERNLQIKKIIENSDSVSVHIRRGDYLKTPFHGAVCTDIYYRRCFKYIREQLEEPSFFIFSDDINWCREKLEGDFEYIDWNTGKQSYIDMFLMSCCSHNILANSSFCWWAAWLGENKGKIILAPDIWYLLIPYSPKPPRWLEISTEPKKVSEDPFLSIIVPVYNVANYLRECLNSIIHQSYTDFELILVNDGSTDDSFEICREYGKKDPRLIVISQENRGPGAARNRGVKNARGEYIQFIDAYDYLVDDTCIEDVCTYLKRQDIDMLYFKAEGIPDTSWFARLVETPFQRYAQGFINHKLNQDYADHLCLFPNAAWLKIYKRQNIVDFPFPEDHIHYSVDLSFKTLVFAQDMRIYMLPRSVYVHRIQGDNSITQTSNKNLEQNNLSRGIELIKAVSFACDILRREKYSSEVIRACYSTVWVPVTNCLQQSSEKIHDQIKSKILEFSSSSPLLEEQDFNGNRMAYEIYRELLFCDYDALVRWIRRETSGCIFDKDSLIENYDKALQKVSEACKKTTDERNQVRLDRDKTRTYRDKIKADLAKIKADLAKVKAERDQLRADRWYRFGQLSIKRKIWELGIIISLKLRIYKVLRPLAAFVVNRIKKR